MPVSFKFGLSACGDSKAAAAAAAPPAVHVATVAVQRTVTDWDTFTGRFEAIDSVKLRPRVSGYIDQVSFAEGKDVKKGDVLFVIDPRPYRVQLERTQGELARAKAQAELSEKELRRSESLLAAHAVSQEEYEQRASQRNQLTGRFASGARRRRCRAIGFGIHARGRADRWSRIARRSHRR